MGQYMNVDEARGVCKDLSSWRSVVSTYPHGKKELFTTRLHIKLGK